MIDINIFSSSSKGNCYLINDGSTQLLLECGINFKEIQRKLNFQTSKLDGVLVSHEHQDHSKAVKDLVKAGIDVYMSLGTADAVFPSYNDLHGHIVKIVEASKQFTIGTWTILPFENQHDAAEPLGFLLHSQSGDKLLFATDTYYIKYKFKDLTHIMIEANYSIDILNQNVANGIIPSAMKKRLLKSHFSLEHVKDFLKANDLSRVKAIYLLHLSDNNSDAERFKREISELTGKVVYVAGD